MKASCVGIIYIHIYIYIYVQFLLLHTLRQLTWNLTFGVPLGKQSKPARYFAKTGCPIQKGTVTSWEEHPPLSHLHEKAQAFNRTASDFLSFVSDFSHFLGLDHFSGKQKTVWVLCLTNAPVRK